MVPEFPYVYFQLGANAPQSDNLAKVRIGDRKIEKIKSLEAVRQVGFFGNWFGLAPG